MSHPILVTGAVGGKQGSTGRPITSLLLQQSIPVRALVYKLDSSTIFATDREAPMELVVNNSQFQGTPDDPAFRDLKHAASFRNFQHRLADRIFDWAQVGTIHLAALLAKPGVPSRSAYAVVGETPIVGEMGRAIGRPIRYITGERWAAAAKERFGPDALDHLSHLWQTFRKGQTLEEFLGENARFFAASTQEA
jgi:hypothetical protein